MVYPSKISAAAIIEEAFALIEAKGADALSLREVAARLGVAPNAIYRYYPSREALLAAVADRATAALLTVVREATAAEQDPLARVAAAGRAYLAFARERTGLQALVLRPDQTPPEGELPAHERLWTDVLGLLAPLVPEADLPAAGVTLWAYLHGIASLEHAGLLGDLKPNSADWGLAAVMRGMRSEGR